MTIQKTADKGIPADRRRKTAAILNKSTKEASGSKPADYLADMSNKVKSAKG